MVRTNKMSELHSDHINHVLDESDRTYRAELLKLHKEIISIKTRYVKSHGSPGKTGFKGHGIASDIGSEDKEELR